MCLSSESLPSESLPSQRTPWGGGKKRGLENLTNDTPPKKGVSPRTVRFPPPSGVVALFFLYKNPRLSRPEALLEGSRIFREGAFSGTFSSPHTFCTPPYHGPTFGPPVFGIPAFISISGESQCWVFPPFEIAALGIPVFRIPTFGTPAFLIPTFGSFVEFRAPLLQPKIQET